MTWGDHHKRAMSTPGAMAGIRLVLLVALLLRALIPLGYMPDPGAGRPAFMPCPGVGMGSPHLTGPHAPIPTAPEARASTAQNRPLPDHPHPGHADEHASSPCAFTLLPAHVPPPTLEPPPPPDKLAIDRVTLTGIAQGRALFCRPPGARGPPTV